MCRKAIAADLSLSGRLMLTDMSFVLTVSFVYKVAIIVGVSSLPLYLWRVVRQRLRPAAYTKVADF
jgi:hypothetical protein